MGRPCYIDRLPVYVSKQPRHATYPLRPARSWRTHTDNRPLPNCLPGILLVDGDVPGALGAFEGAFEQIEAAADHDEDQQIDDEFQPRFRARQRGYSWSVVV